MSLVFSPLTISLLAILVLAIARAIGSRWLTLLAIVAGLPALGLMTPLGANLLVLAIERQVDVSPDSPVCQNLDAIVLLSGGLRRPAEAPDDFDALTPESLSRLFTFINMHRDSRLPLVIAGGGPFQIAESDVIAELLERHQQWPEAVIREVDSIATRDSASAVAELLGPGRRRIALTTSALHLPRAHFAFSQAEFTVCPWPLNRRYLKARGITALLPSSSALRKSESALHELIGMLYYRFSKQPLNKSVSTLWGNERNG